MSHLTRSILALCQRIPADMHSALLLALCLLAVSLTPLLARRITLHEDARDDVIARPRSEELTIEYHTRSGTYQPGCERTFRHAGKGLSFNMTIRRLAQTPLVSSQIPAGQPGSSPFPYCYNAAYVPLPNGQGEVATALLLRCQDLTNASDPYSVGPSFLALATQDPTSSSGAFLPLTKDSVVFQPEEAWEVKGTEDPRITYDNKTGLYYLMYSACSPESDGGVLSRLSLATTHDPSGTNDKWLRHGFVVANNGSGADPSDYGWSKSGALLAVDMEAAPEEGPSVLIFGDSSIVAGLQTAAPSSDYLNYTFNRTIFLPVRSDHFDSDLVEAGPAPFRLSNGMRFFIYNSARVGYPSPKPGWATQYNVGFLLLDPVDPYTILYRSELPIFSPELGWETGTAPWLGLTPNVVFVEGARWVPGQPVVDTFDFWYGAADSCVGGARISITIGQ
jgi:predicted GH43/DUF377 family glycosyl hydrolase